MTSHPDGPLRAFYADPATRTVQPRPKPATELRILRGDKATLAELTVTVAGTTRTYTTDACRHPDDFDNPDIGALVATARALAAAAADAKRQADLAIRRADYQALQAAHDEAAREAANLYERLGEVQDWIDQAGGNTTHTPEDTAGRPAYGRAWGEAHRHRQILAARLEKADRAAYETQVELDKRGRNAQRLYIGTLDDFYVSHDDHPDDPADRYDPLCPACQYDITGTTADTEDQP